MQLEELDYKERALIEILRSFSFLTNISYYGKEFSVSGRSNPSVVFYNTQINRIVKVLGDESQSFSVVIQRKKLFDFKKSDSFFDISDYYKAFGGSMVKGKNYTLKSQADFIQQHLLPVIKGELWIDELIKQKK